MDIVSRAAQPGGASAKLPLAFQPDHIAELTRALHSLDGLVGHPVLMGGGVVGIEVDRAKLVQFCRVLRDELGFEMLSSVSGVDMRDHLETVYHIRSTTRGQLIQLKVRLDHEQPSVESVVSVWPTANWLERETYDLFGIHFAGHPDLRRMLLDDDFEGHPLLKSFKPVPMTRKPQATTQVDPNMAVSDRFQQRQLERVVQKKLGQGLEERLHPGTPTFGHSFHGAEEANQEEANPEGESVPHQG